uniref:Uncharacterized protein n=1 Tax=Arundo donax TaxID=35708 RepID=A0A0A9ET01_ARUDO
MQAGRGRRGTPMFRGKGSVPPSLSLRP